MVQQSDIPLHVWGYMDMRLPAERRNLTHTVDCAKRGKPVFSPAQAGKPTVREAQGSAGKRVVEKANADPVMGMDRG